MRLVTVPGINGSGEQHWQTLWEAMPGQECSRFSPASWDEPEAGDWIRALGDAVAAAGPGCVVVAHSLGCLAAAQVAATDGGMRGVVLVAPPDPGGPSFPAEARTFGSLRPRRLRVPALVIASDDDPYATPEASDRMARAWDVPVISVGARGHLNEASALGAWPEGHRLVTAFAAGTASR